jgi:hypothetical protein
MPRSTGFGRAETVMAPPIYEGVGKALRQAYVSQAPDLPVDFAALLSRLP